MHLGKTKGHTRRWSPRSDRYVEEDRVSRTCLVEAGVVDAHPKPPVGLRDDDRVGQPLGVVDLLDEASVTPGL